MAGLTLVSAAGLLAALYVMETIPLPADLGTPATVVRAADGSELGALQPERGREVSLAELPPELPEAVLAAEDAGFHEHHGISLSGIARAALVNLRSGRIEQGGSTITQQYVKIAVLQDGSRTTLRKLREAIVALKLERRYDKNEILEFYLNSIYFGRGAYGVQAAAEAYFAKPAPELSVAESVLLAALIPAPSVTDPLMHPDRAAARYEYVITRLRDEGWIDAAEATGLREAGVPTVQPRASLASGAEPFFLRLVADEIDALFAADPAAAAAGLEVTTTLDPRLQAIAEESYGAAFATVDGPTGALVALAPSTGGIVALVGGPDYAVDQVNLALASRQPGSTFKPFALAAWLEQGGSPDDRFSAPAAYTIPAGDNGRDYRVANYGGTTYPTLTLREATWRSVNTVYAQVAERVGFERVADAAVRAGIPTGLPPFPSLVLGTEEVTPLALGEAYNTFASGGIRRRSFTVAEVRRGDEVLFTRRPTESRAFAPSVAATVTDVLRGVLTAGTGQAAAADVDAAGKTGTTNDHGDAWFAGYTPSLTAVVWMGHRDDRAPMGGAPTGGGLPARLWGAFVSRAHAEVLTAPVSFPPAPQATDGPLEQRSAAPAQQGEHGSAAPARPDEQHDIETLSPAPQQAAPQQPAATTPSPSPTPPASAPPSAAPSPQPSPLPAPSATPSPMIPAEPAPASPQPSPASEPPPAQASPQPRRAKREGALAASGRASTVAIVSDASWSSVDSTRIQASMA